LVQAEDAETSVMNSNAD